MDKIFKNFIPDLTQRVFRLFHVLNNLSVNEIFSAIYNSEFYDYLITLPEQSFGYSTYWAYYEIACQSQIVPEKPQELYNMKDIDSKKVRLATGAYEYIRKNIRGIEPGYLAEKLILRNFFTRMVDGAMNEYESRKFCDEYIEKEKQRIARLYNSSV